MADVHGDPGAPGLQMPQKGDPGPAPVPYAGASQEPEPPLYNAEMGPMADGTGDVLAGAVNLGTTQAAGAHDIGSADMGISATADAPYYPGQLSPIGAAGDGDPGGRDPVAGAVSAAVSSATGRWQNLQGDLGQGSVIGDLMQFPPGPLDPGAGVGNTQPTAGFYDPPRGYGGADGAPGYGGDQPPPGYQADAQ